jgi:hypothetical protein
VKAIWVAPASVDVLAEEHFLDLPFPNDLRRDADGTIRIKGLYNPQQNATLASYINATKGLLDGFSTVAAEYLRFEGDLDPASLPASPPDSVSKSSAIQLVDVDPSSPEHGKRRMVQWYFRKCGGVVPCEDKAGPGVENSYWLPRTLAVMPAMGQPLRPKTRYALVVTKAARPAGGGSLAPSADLLEAMGRAKTTTRTQAAHDALAPVLAELDLAGVPSDYVVSLTWFTTNDPTRELFAITDWTKQKFDAPKFDPNAWKLQEAVLGADVYEGVYGPAPNFQAGKLPFTNDGDGGSFAFDAAGNPVVQSTFTMRATMVVPIASKCPMPANGYPIALYAHGTGGNYRSVVSEGHPIGTVLAAQCIASMGVDQIFHGTRPGAPQPEGDPQSIAQIQTLFFNFGNALAARTNGRQSAVDVTQQARLFTKSLETIPVLDGAAMPLSRTGAPIKFDPTRVLFVGHSQGGVNGPMFLAADDAARGGVLSGTGADLRVALLEKTKPSPSVARVVRLMMGLTSPDFDTELNYFHPMINLAQTLVDPTDPYVYMSRIAREPRPGFAPKSVYQTEGIGEDGVGDSYAPPHGIEIASVAIGLPRQLPGIRAFDEAKWAGIADVTVPAEGLSGNLAGGKASGIFAQFAPLAGSDGHFVIFDIKAASNQAAVFCKNLVDDPKGKVPQLP